MPFRVTKTHIDVDPRRSAVVLDEPEPAEYLVLGDLGGQSISDTPSLIDRDNFDQVLAKFGLRLSGADFRELEDYHPDRLFQRLDWFAEFREKPAENASKKESSTPKIEISEILKPTSLLEQIVEGSSDPFTNYLEELSSIHAAPKFAPDDGKLQKLGETMRAVLHHPRFQAIEAAWRGLDFVLRQSDVAETQPSYVRVAHLPKAAALADLNTSTSLRETRLFSLLKQRKWRAVIGLYSFGGDAQDIEFLGRIALLAANAQTPFLAEGSADMGANWDELRAVPEAGYIGLALPRILLRLPYGSETSPLESFVFEEMPGEPQHSQYLWGNPALACLALMIAGERDLDLERLPIHTFKKNGEWKMTPCAELWLSEAEVDAMIQQGLMPLVSFKDTDRVRLAGFRAINGKALPFRN